jgi:anaerobic selenocysteine-containing dehydrogenase
MSQQTSRRGFLKSSALGLGVGAAVVTAGLVAATYTVSVDALNASMQAIGTAPTLTNKVISSPNKVTNLGTINIPITGM